MKKILTVWFALISTALIQTPGYGQVQSSPVLPVEQRFDSLYQAQTFRMKMSFWSGPKLLRNEKPTPSGTWREWRNPTLL